MSRTEREAQGRRAQGTQDMFEYHQHQLQRQPRTEFFFFSLFRRAVSVGNMLPSRVFSCRGQHFPRIISWALVTTFVESLLLSGALGGCFRDESNLPCCGRSVSASGDRGSLREPTPHVRAFPSVFPFSLTAALVCGCYDSLLSVRR